MKLRDYQEAAVESIFYYFSQGKKGCPIVALPTGTGKSVVIAAFIRRALETYPGTRIMKLTHVKELIEQNLEKLLAIWPTAPAGVYSAGLKRKDSRNAILFGGVGTVARCPPDSFGKIDLLLIDECHLVSSKEGSMYQKVIEGLKKTNPFLKVVGFTATHYRLGQGMLTEKGGIFTDVCFDMTKMGAFNWLLEEGHLCRLIPKSTSVQLDVTGVRTHNGDFKQDELQLAVDKDVITYAAGKELMTYGHDRNHWLIFASGIDHAVHIADMLDSLGVATTCVHSKMSVVQRDAAIADFRKGKYRAMVNNGILTTGFDFPAIDLIGMLRPTQSTGLWVQMLGRGTRPHPGKENCLVLDFARNTKRLGPINDPVLPKRKGSGSGTAPVRLCPSCDTYNHASVRFCVVCGGEFPRAVKINAHAGTEELIVSSPPKTEIFKVDRVTYAVSKKEARPDTLQVSYFCGLRLFREWVCLEHSGFAGKKARDWWRDRALKKPPDTTSEALAKLTDLRMPTHLRVWLKPKYPEILAYDYTGTSFGETQ